MKSKFHLGLKVYTAVMVPVAGFMVAVVTAIIIYAIAYKWIPKQKAAEMTERQDLVA